MNATTFQLLVLAWFDQHGRKDLPWQQEISPYRVWLSEIMLQQTQVVTVIPYFLAFTKKFPDVESLASASLDDVLAIWSGLGYYARARNLHKTAQIICSLGRFPETFDELTALPGIGQSTAGAILSIAFEKSHPILDGNVKRVLTRFKAIAGWPSNSETNKQLWILSAQLTPTARVGDYTQAMMDLGATVCTRTKPLCNQCPLASACVAHLTQTVTDYPNPKLTKPLPVKMRIFLLLYNDQHQVILEKRPASGIWGGLWSLPEFSDVQTAVSWCVTHNLLIIDQRLGNLQRHSFSHYHLDYSPLFIKTQDTENRVLELDRNLWYDESQCRHLGLAAPVKLILKEHFEELIK